MLVCISYYYLLFIDLNIITTVANDNNWLTNTLSKTSQSDIFTGKLFEIYKEVISEGIKQPITIGNNYE